MSEHAADPVPPTRPPAARRDPLGLAQLLGDASCVPLSDLDGAALLAPAGACGGCSSSCPSDFVPLADLSNCPSWRPA